MLLLKQDRIKRNYVSAKLREEKEDEDKREQSIQKLVDKASDKSTLEFDEDFFTLTVLSYLKSNRHKW